MSPFARTSPLHERLVGSGSKHAVINGMQVPFGRRTAAVKPIEIADLSALRRTGVKGKGAAHWLQAMDVPIPEQANTWIAAAGGAFVLRLGRNEFLIEDQPGAALVESVETAIRQHQPDGVYPVLRQDAALVVRGAAVPEMLAQVCSIDLGASAPAQRAVYLTMMAGIAVTAIAVPSDVPCWRIWCDSTYALYFWDALSEVIGELGGDSIGLDHIFPDAMANGSEAFASHQLQHPGDQE